MNYTIHSHAQTCVYVHMHVTYMHDTHRWHVCSVCVCLYLGGREQIHFSVAHLCQRLPDKPHDTLITRGRPSQCGTSCNTWRWHIYSLSFSLSHTHTHSHSLLYIFLPLCTVIGLFLCYCKVSKLVHNFGDLVQRYSIIQYIAGNLHEFVKAVHNFCRSPTHMLYCPVLHKICR